MILFLDDWKKYPGAIADTKTKNRSFVELADLYRKMGVKNYMFPLALHNPALQGIDPFDPNLTLAQKVLVKIEVKENPWYFFREVFRIPSQGSPEPDKLRANRGNIGAYWLYFNHIDVALIQPRQTGKSIAADGINTYIMQIAGESTTFSLITKDHDLRVKNIKRLKLMRDALPEYLNTYAKNIDSNNPYGLTNKEYGNEMFTGVAQSSVIAADNLGRGSTSPNNQIDEGPFCKLIHITFPTFLSSSNTARDNARRNNSFYGNIYTTTAGKLDTVEGAYMYDLFTSGMVFDERKLFNAKNARELNLIVQTNAKGKNLIYMSLSHRQLGYTDEWLYSKMLDSKSTGDIANRDYMNIWTTGSLSSPLSQAILNRIVESERSSTYVEMTNDLYYLDWYIPEDEIADRLSRVSTVLGNDMSKAVGKDSITLVLTDTETLEVLMTVEVNETNTYVFINWVCELMKKYPRIVINPEHQQVGIALIDGLLDTLVAHNINPFKRIYNTIVDDGLYNEEEFRFIHREPSSWSPRQLDKYKRHFGYTTSGSGRHSRHSLYLTITRLAELSADRVHSNTLSKQIRGLVRKGDRIDHACAGHDDMVIAWLLAGWMLLNSRNLDFYGIDRPLSKAKTVYDRDKEKVEKQKTPYERALDEEQRILIENVDKLLKDLENTVDNYEITVLETRIKNLSLRIKAVKYETNNISDLINQAKRKRDEAISDRRSEAEWWNNDYYQQSYPQMYGGMARTIL